MRAAHNGSIVRDHAEEPGKAERWAQAAEAFHASCEADDRPYATATPGHRRAEVVPDLAPCSWV